MESEKKLEHSGTAGTTVTPDSPIDLSQLSTRCRAVDLNNRSVSESCLAPSASAAAAAAKKRRIHGFKDPLPPPTADQNSHSADTLKYRSMSHADIAGYRAPWLPADSERIPSGKRSALQRHEEKTSAISSNESIAETLKSRCMSDSRLGGASHVSSSGTSGSSMTSRKSLASHSDLLRAAAVDNNHLEFLLRRTASESFIQSRYLTFHSSFRPFNHSLQHLIGRSGRNRKVEKF